MNIQTLAVLLNDIYEAIDADRFVAQDPIQIPKKFCHTEDIEISAFLTSTIAWGNRKQIIANAYLLMDLMNHKPYDFIMSLSSNEQLLFNSFKHRTIKGKDIFTICRALNRVYKEKGGLFPVIYEPYICKGDLKYSLINLYAVLSDYLNDKQALLHIGNVTKGSAAKRLNMFLRWMVRKDCKNIDIGIWNKISSADLYIPLDLHVSRAARKLGLLQRKQNDWKAVEELTNSLKQINPSDPVKYDFSLFIYSLNHLIDTNEKISSTFVIK